MPTKEGGISLVSLASSLTDPASVERVVSSYRRWLSGTFDEEFHCATTPEEVERIGLSSSAGVLAVVVSGGTEQLIRAVAAQKKPVLILAHESMNSFPASLEALSSLSGSNVKMLLGKGSKKLADAKRFAEAARTLARMSHYRIGLVGGSSPWLVYSQPDGDALANRLGIGLVEISMDEFRDAYSSISEHVIATQTGRSGTAAVLAKEAPASDLGKSVRIYAALRGLAEKHDLTSITPRCFDFIKDFGATGCLALSRLNDEGLVAGCEGDVPSTVGMITLAEVSGKPTFMGNPSFIDGHRLVVAHCTVATKLTKEFHYRTHFESGLGVALAGQFRRGARVTVGRYAKGYSLLRAGAGTIARGQPWSKDLCRTQVEIRTDGNADVFWKRPIGNHLVMTYGDHVGALRELASVAGIEFEEV